MHGERKMKTNDIKITQRAEYYYTAIDLFQTVHQNRSVLGVLGCKADAQKAFEFFFLMLAPAFLPGGGGWCHCSGAEMLPACSPATTPRLAAADFILLFAWGLSGEKNILMRILA